MKINDEMNLVIPVVRETGTIYVYSTPVSWDVFDMYHQVLGKAYDALTGEGFNLIVCLATAKLALQDAAKTLDVWSGPDGVQSGFLGEIRRTTMVNYPTDKGWEQLTLDDAVKRSILDYEEVREVENALVFFTLSCRLFTKEKRLKMLKAITLVGDYQLTSLNSTEYRDSLPMSTKA